MSGRSYVAGPYSPAPATYLCTLYMLMLALTSFLPHVSSPPGRCIMPRRLPYYVSAKRAAQFLGRCGSVWSDFICISANHSLDEPTSPHSPHSPPSSSHQSDWGGHMAARGCARGPINLFLQQPRLRVFKVLSTFGRCPQPSLND